MSDKAVEKLNETICKAREPLDAASQSCRCFMLASLWACDGVSKGMSAGSLPEVLSTPPPHPTTSWLCFLFQVYTYVQLAKACVHSYPWTPDTISMLETIAEDKKEPLAAELLGQPQLQTPVVYDPSGQRRWIDQDIMTHDSKEGI